jgi:hypothetical protein
MEDVNDYEIERNCKLWARSMLFPVLLIALLCLPIIILIWIKLRIDYNFGRKAKL